MGYTHCETIFSTSAGVVPWSETTTPRARPPRACPACAVHVARSPVGASTWASMISSGWREPGLGGRGNLSEVPVLGGVKAESGRVGRVLGPLRRAPTLGERGVGGSATELIVWRGEVEVQ